MPGFDGTGPGGGGPMTGGGRGFCNPAGNPGYGYGRGFGRGFRGGRGAGAGWGRGYGRGFAQGGYPPAWGGSYGPNYNPNYNPNYGTNPEDELSMLKGDAEAVKKELDAINRRIQDLESNPTEA